MILYGKRAICQILIAVFALIETAAADTVTISLDNVTQSACDVVWIESGCELNFTATTAADYTPGFCLVMADANNFGRSGVYLWPGRLVLNLNNIVGLETVEVDIYETHFAGSTRARLYREGGEVGYTPSFQEDHQTLVLDNSGKHADQLVISAHEAYVWEIRLIGQTLVSTGRHGMSMVKARYQ